MAENRSIGRGGRGAQLRDALQQLQRRPGQGSEKPTEVQATPKASALANSRLALLEQLRSKSNVPSSQEQSGPSRPIGRGQLLSSLAANSRSPEQQKPQPSRPPQQRPQPSRSEQQKPPSSEEEVPSLSKLSLNHDKPPVIKRGNDGKE